MTNGAWLHRIALTKGSELRGSSTRVDEGSPSRPVLGALP